MKKFKSILGVTLLEIMLVLAIAAMIIVMSVRYYQTASSGQQVNGMLQMIQSISAAADGLAQGSGSYQTGGVATATVQPLMPNNSMNAPWGGAASITGATDSTYTVSFTTVPAAVCSQVKSRLTASSKFNATATTCPSTGSTTFTYTYDAST
jgi:type II secretory pathway pseudopilin PulG